jgi:hypothetical protein
MPDTWARDYAISVLTSQNVTVSGASAQSAPFIQGARLVRLVSTTDCYVAFGTNPTAVATSVLLPAGQPEYFAVKPGWRVAAIQATAGGTLNIAECE